MRAPPAIVARDLAKQFTVYRRAGRLRRERSVVEAVAGVSFTVGAGEMVGYIGPNGAGKSTTVKMLTGILTPTSGDVRVLGFDPVRERVDMARRIGVVFGQRTQLWWDLPLEDSFDLLRHVYRVPVDAHRARLDECTDLLDLGEFLATPVRQLSLGQRMRGELTAAILHDPDLLVLDEPTIGLDVVSQHALRIFLADLNERHGTTVVLTTHDLDDVAALCTRVLVIDRGVVVHDGDLAALRDLVGGERTLVIDLHEPGSPVAVPGAEVVRVDGVRQWLRFETAETTAADVVAAVMAQVRLRDLSVEEMPIDDVIRRLYAGE